MDKETKEALGIGERETNIFQGNNNKGNADTSTSSNVVARKFKLVVNTVKLIGYIAAFFVGIYVFDATGEEFFPGLLAGLGVAVSVWLSTLVFEAIAEALNLLQDIKNKLK